MKSRFLKLQQKNKRAGRFDVITPPGNTAAYRISKARDTKVHGKPAHDMRGNDKPVRDKPAHDMTVRDRPVHGSWPRWTPSFPLFESSAYAHLLSSLIYFYPIPASSGKGGKFSQQLKF
jgi:hypothetical protein